MIRLFTFVAVTLVLFSRNTATAEEVLSGTVHAADGSPSTGAIVWAAK